MATKPSAGVTSEGRRKLALVIGIGDYASDGKLKNAENDAVQVSNLLKNIGFITHGPKLNLTYEEMKEACTTFEGDIQKGDMVLFYFAGHGVQWEDQNYLVPKDNLNINTKSLNLCAIRAQRILDDLSDREPCITIFLLDCCRIYHLRNNDLYSNHRGLNTSTPKSVGLKEMNKAGSLIGFACAAGTVADDGGHQQNGLFTKYLLKHMATPNVEVVDLLRRVIYGVREESQSSQNPYLTFSLTDQNIYLYEPESGSNVEICFHGGKLLTCEQQQKLNEFYGKNEAQWQLIYRATKDGFAAKNFHHQCDGKGPTMTIIKSKTDGYLFGGYTAIPWSSDNGRKTDPTAFLFTLKNPRGQAMTKFNIQVSQKKMAVYHYTHGGPIFGGVTLGLLGGGLALGLSARGYYSAAANFLAADICVQGDCDTNNCTIDFPQAFNDTLGDKNITFTGAREFTCDDIEIYQLK